VRKAIVLSLPLVVPAVLALIASCDDGGTLAAHPDAGAPDATQVEAGPVDDGGADATSGDGESIEASMTDVCGQPPYVTLGIVVIALDLSNPDGSVLPGATFTSPLCPGFEQVSDDAGVIEGQITANKAFFGRLQAKNYISELAPEEIYDADSIGTHIEMLPQLLAAIAPGYEADAATIAVAVEKTVDDAGACSSLDGVTLSVVGHPEVTVSYLSAGSIPLPQLDASATTTRGFAVMTGLTGIDGTQFVTLAASKPGCNVVFARGPITGRVPVENGFASLMPAYLTP
jgi:hypothetical protein